MKNPIENIADQDTYYDNERVGDCSAAPCSGDAPDFITELRDLLNCRSMENGSDTPDFILAQYLTDCLRAWNRATKRREDWYGRTPQEVPPPNVKGHASPEHAPKIDQAASSASHVPSCYPSSD